MKINSEGEPEKHCDYPCRLESLRGIGFWNAYQTKEEAVVEIGELLSRGHMRHYPRNEYDLTISEK